MVGNCLKGKNKKPSPISQNEISEWEIGEWRKFSGK